MTNREYLEDQDADEPDDFIISLTSLVSGFFYLIKLFFVVNVNKIPSCTVCLSP
jgi:hypothetical protein